MENRPISELELATSVNDEDILLISQKENNQYISRKIGAGVFRGASAYELAVNNGFNGSLNDWLSSIKGWQPITSGEFVDLLNKELDKSTLYLDLKTKINTSTSELRQEINKQLNDISNLKDQVVAEADKRIKEIHDLNSGLIEEANKRIQDIQVIQQSITLESDERLRQASALADKLLEEKEVRTQEIKNLATKLEDEQNDRIFEIENIINDLNSEVAVRREMIKDAVDKITKEAEERVQALNAIQESITKDQQERLVEIENILQSIDALDTQVGTNHSYILNNYSTTKQANELTATQIEALKTTYIDPQLEQKASTTALQQITTEVGKLDEGLKANIKKVDGVFAQVNPNMAGSSSGSVGQDSSFVGVWTEQSARIEEDFALGQRINNVVATYTSNKGVTDARIAQEEKVRADADSALASIVTSLTSKVGDSEGKILTLQEVNTEQNKSISQISSKLDNTVQALDTKASSSALTDLTSNVEVLEDKVESSTSSITLLKNSLNVVEDGLSKKADGSALSELASKVSVIDGTLTSTNSSVTSLTSSVGTKNRTYYQTTTPTGTLVSGDLWVNSSAGKNNEIKRYNGTSWVAITDPRTAANSSAISSLQTTTTQNQDSITTQGRLITDLQSELDLSKNNLLLKADASALNDLSSKVTSVDGKVTSVSQDLLELHNNLTSIEEGLELKAEASALRDLTSKVEDTGDLVRSQSQDITSLSNSLISIESEVDTKGRVIYSDNEPSQEDRINNNLWIDTSGGKNTPKMWDGVSWVAVSDKVATDALKQAELNKTALTTKADSSAVASLTNKVEVVEKNITSQSTDLVVLKNSLEEVSTVSNDKGKVIFSSTQPKDADKVVQNLWIDTSDNKNTPKRWTGTQWVPVTDKVALDALAASNETLTKLNTKADASAVSSLDSKVTKINETLTSQSTDITTLNNSLVVANDKLSTKGKIIYSDSTPVEGDRLPQNLWIDTKGGGNIPKRWNGEFWLVVTDKTAVDALAAANQAKQDLATKVDSSAFNSLSSQVTSAEQKISSQSDSITKLNNSLEATDEVAKEALAGVSGLTQQITTKASTEALENLSSSVTSINGQVQANTQKVIELSSDIETIEEDLATKVDASVLVDYSTKMSTEEAISKASTTLTSSYTKAVNDSKAATDLKLDDQLLINKVSSSGKLLFTDVTFLKGTNSVAVYDNKNTGKVRVDRITKESDNPTKSTHQLKITIAEGANPNYGGFYQIITARANATFVIKYLMKVPVNYKLVVAGNSLGTGSSDKIIGSDAGTGRYETYIRVIRCGSTGTFTTGGHLSFRGTNLTTGSTDTIMLASIETWDATDFIRAATSDEVASINASLINDYYTIAAADKAISNSLTAFKTNYVDQELNKKASANTVEQITNEINNTETGLNATAEKLSGVYAQVNPEFIGADTGSIGADSGSVSVWSEYSARIEGDLALSSRIDNVSANLEGNLASVQTQTKATSDKVSSLASQMTVLSSAVEGNISLVMDQYYTKVETGQVVAQSIVDLKANYISPELNLKASSQALQETQTQVTEIDGKLKTTSQRTEGVYAQVNPNLIGDNSGSIGDESQNVGSWSQYSALIEGDFATSQKIDNISVRVANNTASINQTNTVVIDKFRSVAESLNKVESKFNENLSSVNSVIGVWTDKDKTLAKYVTDLNSIVGSNQAEITKNYLTTVDTKSAITEGIDRFKTEYLSDELKKKASAEVLDQVKAAIENTENGLVATANKLDGVFLKVNPKLIGSDEDFIGKTSSSVGVWTEYSARIEEDFALGNRIDNLHVNLGKNASSIQEVNEVLTDKTQALANSIIKMDSKFENSLGSITTKLGTWTSSESSISDYVLGINSVVGKNSSSIQVQGKSIDGLSSQYTVKIDTNGRVSGFGLASNPANQATSEFAVVADKFYVASPQESGKGKSPFYILPTQQVIDGVTVPAGTYINQSFIRKASIGTAHIQDAAIVDAKIFNLDASKITTGFISADRIEAGTIQSKHIGVNAIEPTNFSYSVYKQFNETFVSIEDAYADGKLTPIEKRSIKEQVEFIDMEFETVKDSVATFKVPHARVKYDALKTYLETLDLNSETITAIDRMVYEKSFADYYAELRSNQNNLFKEIENLNGASIKAAKTANDLLTAWKTYGQDTLYIDDTRIAVKMIGAEQIAADSITADKIKFGSVTSKTLSEELRTDIGKGTSAYKTVADLAANLNDDNIITPTEKTFLFDKWQEIQKVSSWIDWQCTNVFKNSQDKETIYDPFYTVVKNFIAERVSKDGLNVSNNIIDFAISSGGKVLVGSEALRQMMLDYYNAENKILGKLQQTQYNFTSNVNDKVTTASSVLDNIANDNIITKQEKPALKLQYTNIINDYDDLILAANNQELTSSNFTTAYTQLVNAFDSIFANMAVDTNWSGSDLRSKMKNYSDQRGIIVQTLSNDAKNKANEAALNALSALQALGKMSDDNVITIYEKPALSFSWQNIINDYDELVAACVTQNVSSAEFKTAYTNLKQAVDLILANPKVDTEWNGADLRNRMKAYADARGVTVQRLSNDAKAKAEAAMAAITDAVSDRILTPSEKQQFKIKWIEEYQDFEKLKLKAQEAGINTSTGNYTGYVSAFNYINDTFIPVWNSANNSQVDPTEWKTRFENLRKYKSLLENEISAKIKDIASSALNATQQLTQTVAKKAESSALSSLDHDVKVIDGKVKAYGESITSLSADLSDKVGKGDVNSIISETQKGKKHIISTEGLDNNLYYPVTIAVNGLFSKISMLISLGEAKASWATHGAGWSCGLTVTQRAGGWGGNSPDLTIEKFDYAWTNQSPIINIGHLGTMSSALFYVRGGSKYHFYTDSNCYNPQLWTEKKIFNEQYNVYVEPISYSSGLEPKSLKQNVQSNSVATSTLRANVDEINGKVVAQSSSILTLQTNVDTISRDLTTKANSSVLVKYYTKDEADTATAGKIENFNSSFEIGGRNYFRKTTPLNPHQLQEVRRDLPDTPNGFYVIGSQTPSNNLRLPGVITGNGKWTISGWVRGSQNTAISFFIDICDKKLSNQIVINKDGTNSWEKFTYTITVDNYSSDTYNFVDISNLSWAYFYFKDIKIEKGSKATDWTPAPEDIDQKLTSIDASISTLQNTTANNTQSIATTQNQLNARFDALSVGGRNLFVGSKQLIQVGGNRVNNVENGIFKTVSNGTEQYIDIGCYQPLSAGKYTISVQVRSAGLDKGVCLPYYSGGWKSYEFYPVKDTGGTWTTVSKVIELSQETPNFKLALDNFSNTTGTLDFRLPKVEKGILATDWTPAPEDIDQKFIETDANIKTTYITKSDATQAISSAKTELTSSYNKSLTDSRADGVNLINFSKMVPGYFVADGSIGQADTDHMDMNYYSCIGDESFTCHMSKVTGPVGGTGRVLWYDSNKIFISSSDCNRTGTYTPYTFKSPVNARFYRYSMIGKYPAAHIKLERGTLSTGFSFSDLDESFYRVLLIQALSGNQLLSNPDFRDNNSGVRTYDNAGTGRVTLDRVPKDPDNPSNSSHQLNCTISAGAVPGYGGFVFSVISKYNGLFAIRIVMKVPVGYIVNIASNALPEGTDYRIIGSNEGTGKYETYTILCKCGTTGAQNSFGHVYFTNKSAVKLSGTQTDIVKISKLEAFDATSDKPMVSKANLDEYKQTVANQYGALSENVNTISTKVNDNEAAIKVQAQSINGINAQYTIKTDVNGKVAGIGLVNSGKSSEFAVTADTFRVSNGSTDIAPFTISNNEILFNGKVSFNNVTSAGNLVSNFSKTNSGTGWSNYTGMNSYTSFDGTNTPCMEIHTQHSIQVESDRFKIDPSKSYEFSVWLYSSGGNTTGRDYMGMHTFASNREGIAATAFDVNNPNSNWDESNPYFWHKGYGENYRDKWVKYTGYVLAAGTDLSSIKGVLGQNIDRCFRLKSNTDSMLFRILNYYNDGTTVNKLYMAHPSVKEVDTNSLIETVNNKKATNDLYFPGTTQIDGGKIQTGTIIADKLIVGSITSNLLSSDLSGTINTAYTKSNSAESKINNLVIGGTNLLLPAFDELTTPSTDFLPPIIQPNDIEDGAIYTVSFEVINTSTVTGMGLGFSDKHRSIPYGYFWLPDNSTGKKVWTGPLSSNCGRKFLEIYVNSTCIIKNIKLEKGDRSSGYTKISYYDTINSLILTYPNKRLQNKWSFIAFKKTAPSDNELVNYSHLKGKVVDQGYLDIPNTMFSNPKYDNTYILFRTTITTTVGKVLSIQNLLGDDAHSLAVNGQIYFYKQISTTTSAVNVSLSAGVNVIDIMVSNGGGGAGFSLSTDLRSYGDMYATSLTSIELEDTSNTATSAKTKIDNLKVGSANLLKKSNVVFFNASGAYEFGRYFTVSPLENSKTYTLIVSWGNSGSQTIGFWVDGNQNIAYTTGSDRVTSHTFVCNIDSAKTSIGFYNMTKTSGVAVYWAVLVEGNASGLQAWTPSIYDINTDLNNIFSDNAITPDEKQSLLVTYKQISNDNDIWRNQAYLLGGNISGDTGVNHRRQHNATIQLLSTNRPYLGWVCRNDALNQPDTLNAGERTTLMNAIAEYHAANQELAQRVGSNLRTTGRDALAKANNAYDSANYVVKDNVDLDSLKTTGKYFIRSCTQGNIIAGTENELKIWMYLVVDAPTSSRITQTAWHDQTPDKVWTRVWTEYWQPWKRQTDTQYVKNLITDPNVNTIAAGARDLLNRWKANGNGTLYIDDNSIAVKQIGAEQIAAGSITTEKLAVKDFTNLWVNRDFKNIPSMLFGGNGWFHNAALWNGANYVNGYYCTGSTYGNWETKFRVNGGQEYLLDFIIGYYSGAAPSIGLLLSNDDGGDYSYGCMVTPVNYVALGNGNWHRARCVIKIPHAASVVKWARPWVWFNNGAGEVAIGDLTITRRNGAELIVDGSITGDKIKANTSITAPTINGGTINIGNGNFVVDQWGNLNANSGTFRGTVLAENISGKIDVKSLKKSAIMNGYKMYFAMNQVPEGTTLQKDFNALLADIVFYNKKYEWLSADYVSRGAISYYYGTKSADVGAICFSLTVECVKSKTITQKVLTVDDYVDLVIESLSGVEIHKQLNIGYGRVSKEVSFTLNPGTYVINYVLRNTGWGPCSVNIVGDIIDNDSIFFA